MEPDESASPPTGPATYLSRTVDVDSAIKNSFLLQNRSQSTEDSGKSRLSRHGKQPVAGCNAEANESMSPLIERRPRLPPRNPSMLIADEKDALPHMEWLGEFFSEKLPSRNRSNHWSLDLPRSYSN